MPAGIINVNIALKSTYQTFKIMFSHFLLNYNPSQLISIPDTLSDKIDGFLQCWMSLCVTHRRFPFLYDGLHGYGVRILQMPSICLSICILIFQLGKIME